MRWIKCSKKLPKKFGRYLTFDNETYECYTTWFGETGWFNRDEMGIKKYNVTHWMPLPPPPKGGE